MLNRKSIALPMLAILALSMIGLAYAQFSVPLYTEGSVETTEINWEFRPPPNYLDHPGTLDWNADCTWTYVQLNTDVGGPTEIHYENTDADPGYNKLIITMVNAYPGYAEDISNWVHNNGPLPIVFHEVFINGDIIVPYETVFLDLNDDGNNDIKIKFGNNLGETLQPSQEVSIGLKILVLPSAPTGETISFTITLVAILA